MFAGVFVSACVCVCARWCDKSWWACTVCTMVTVIHQFRSAAIWAAMPESVQRRYAVLRLCKQLRDVLGWGGARAQKSVLQSVARKVLAGLPKEQQDRLLGGQDVSDGVLTKEFVDSLVAPPVAPLAAVEQPAQPQPSTPASGDGAQPVVRRMCLSRAMDRGFDRFVVARRHVYQVGVPDGLRGRQKEIYMRKKAYREWKRWPEARRWPFVLEAASGATIVNRGDDGRVQTPEPNRKKTKGVRDSRSAARGRCSFFS